MYTYMKDSKELSGRGGVYFAEYRETRQRGSPCNLGFLKSMKLLLFRERYIPWEGSNRATPPLSPFQINKAKLIRSPRLEEEAQHRIHGDLLHLL